MGHKNVIERLRPVFERVGRQLRMHLSSDVTLVMKVAEHILFSGGKHVRPTMFVLSAQLCDHQVERTYYFSSVFEYLHAATLLHDDVVDESDTRRGKKAAHLMYGNPGVILVGDFLLAKSMALGAETGMLEFTEVMSTTVTRMAEGEVLQLQHTGDPSISEDEYEEVIYRKTATLFESACYLGAVFAAAPAEQAMALKKYGRLVGLAFQIIDDCLDYSTTAAEFGKPVGHDLDEGKITLPLIKTLAQARNGDREELIRLIDLEARSPADFLRIRTLMDRYAGMEQATSRAEELINEAKSALAPFPDDSTKKALRDLGDFIITRRK